MAFESTGSTGQGKKKKWIMELQKWIKELQLTTLQEISVRKDKEHKYETSA